jgi:hypothetical protein
MDVNRTICAIILRVKPTAVIASVLISSHANAVWAFLPIYGAPTTLPSGSAFHAEDISHTIVHWVNDTGTAVGYGARLNSDSTIADYRSTRWDATGSVNLELGANVPPFQGRISIFVQAMNNHGTAVGTVEELSPTWNNMGMRAIRWDTSGVPTELGNLGVDIRGSSFFEANAINDVGVAVGHAATLDSSGMYFEGYHAVRWNALETTATDLGDLGDDSARAGSSIAYDINHAGTIVGYAGRFDAAGNSLGERPVRWDPGATSPTELPNSGHSPSGMAGGLASAINAAGTIVGYTAKFDAAGNNFGTRAARWDAGRTLTELATLSTDATGKADVQAIAINDAGTVVGFGSNYAGGGYMAMRWDSSGAATNLGTARDAFVRDINNPGASVGTLGARAVLWPAATSTPVYLDTLVSPTSGWRLVEAESISDNGWIVGMGFYDPDGAGPEAAFAREFMIQVPAAAPEPQTHVLVLVTIAALAGTRCRRRSIC